MLLLFGCLSRSICRRLLLIVGAKVVGERCLLFVTGVGQDSDSIVLFLICIEQ